jgi:hypothetical protein
LPRRRDRSPEAVTEKAAQVVLVTLAKERDPITDPDQGSGPELAHTQKLEQGRVTEPGQLAMEAARVVMARVADTEMGLALAQERDQDAEVVAAVREAEQAQAPAQVWGPDQDMEAEAARARDSAMGMRQERAEVRGAITAEAAGRVSGWAPGAARVVLALGWEKDREAAEALESVRGAATEKGNVLGQVGASPVKRTSTESCER